MITIRRSEQRRHDHSRKHEVWSTFFPTSDDDPLAHGFASLTRFDESRLPPSGRIPTSASHEAEVLTFVDEGALAYEDSTGRSGVILAGEFQYRTASRRIHHHERNASSVAPAFIVQMWFEPVPTELEPMHEQKRFGTAERRGSLCIVASNDARRGSLRMSRDASVYSGIVGEGHHRVHELGRHRSAWLHVVRGAVTLGDDVLTAGDGAGVSGERSLSFVAREPSEILLVDVESPPERWVEPEILH